MEGIQHRWDCPNPDAEPDEYAFELADGTTRGYAKCPGCGRAAIIHKPKETTDDKR